MTYRRPSLLFLMIPAAALGMAVPWLWNARIEEKTPSPQIITLLGSCEVHSEVVPEFGTPTECLLEVYRRAQQIHRGEHNYDLAELERQVLEILSE